MTCNSDCHKPHGRQAHCSVCHKTFAGVSVFVTHRLGGKCNDIPGVTEKAGVWGNWGSSMDNQWWVKK